MNRNIFTNILEWDKDPKGRALHLTGAPGTGKTYLSLELAKSFHDSYLYLNPKNDNRLKSALLDCNINDSNDFISFLHTYYKIPTEWLHEFLIIIDDYNCCSKIISILEPITASELNYRLLLVSTNVPSTALQQNCDVITIGPLEFDEYLKAIGSEWYTEIIRAHFQTKKKIPDIVHKEMLNLFRDYLRIGGMPSAINEYLHTESILNVSSVHRNIYEIYLSQFGQFDESNVIRMNQIMNHLTEQLTKDNKNYRYNIIRKGATHNMYRNELQMLADLHIVNKIERADINYINPVYQFEPHENQFRLYLNDCGLLYSLILSSSKNYSDETEEESMDVETQKLYQLLLETYLLQTLKLRSYHPVFWESGSLSKIDFVNVYDSCIKPIEARFYENKRSKSMHIFRQKYPDVEYTKFGLQNFETGDHTVHCPIYSIFCL